jgi:hypothetical protein
MLRNEKIYFRYSFLVALMWKVEGSLSQYMSRYRFFRTIFYVKHESQNAYFFYFILKRILVSVTIDVAPNSFITLTLLQCNNKSFDEHEQIKLTLLALLQLKPLSLIKNDVHRMYLYLLNTPI